MPVKAKTQVAFIVFFSVVYLMLLKIVMDSEWSLNRPRRIVEEKGETGHKEVRSRDKEQEEGSTKDGEDDASLRNSSRVTKVEGDGEGARPLGVVKMTGDDKKETTDTKTIRQEGDVWSGGKKFSTSQRTEHGNTTTDDSETKKYQVLFLKDSRQEDVQGKVSMRKLLMVNSNTEKRETSPERQKLATPSSVPRQRPRPHIISGEDLHPVEPENVAGVAKLSQSTVSRHEELLSSRPAQRNTSSEEPLRFSTGNGHTEGQLLTAVSKAAPPPRLLMSSTEPGAAESLTLDITVRGLGVAAAVDGQQVRNIEALRDKN